MTAGTGPAQSLGPMVFVESLEAPELDAAERHHLERVLRCRVGEPIVLCDGFGRWRMGRLGPTVELDGEVVSVPAPSHQVTVGFALVKADRPELIVQKLTELGVDRIVAMSSDHCVVRWRGADVARQHGRLVRVARSAAAQCRRTWLPTVEALTPCRDLFALPGAVRADFDGAPLTAAHHSILVGPEGGWSEDERATSPEAVRLGVHVLRAETAAIVAGALLTAQRGGIVAGSPSPDG